MLNTTTCNFVMLKLTTEFLTIPHRFMILRKWMLAVAEVKSVFKKR